MRVCVPLAVLLTLTQNSIFLVVVEEETVENESILCKDDLRRDKTGG